MMDGWTVLMQIGDTCLGSSAKEQVSKGFLVLAQMQEYLLLATLQTGSTAMWHAVCRRRRQVVVFTTLRYMSPKDFLGCCSVGVGPYSCTQESLKSSQ